MAPHPTNSPEGTERTGETLGNTPGNRLLKFLIGFFATACAVFLPKIVVFLKDESGGALQVLSTTYVVAGVVFAVLIGVVTLLFEWNKRSKPADIFMTALGIPALVSGTLGTVGTADNLKRQAELNQKIFAQAAQAAEVPILEVPITLPAGGIAPPKSGSVFEVFPSAYAATNGAPVVLAQAQAQYGVQAVRREFLVVVAQTPDRAQAEARARSLRSRFPGAAVVPAGNQFYVTTTSRALPQVEALADAMRLRNENVRASLVPVRK